jgi:hypothetical protein
MARHLRRTAPSALTATDASVWTTALCSPELVDEVGYAPPLLGRGEVDIEQPAHPVNDTAEFLDRVLYTLGVAGPECSFAFAEPLGSVRVALTGDGLTNLSDDVG